MKRTVVLHVVCRSEFYGVQKSVAAVAGGLDKAVFRPLVAAPPGEAFFRELGRRGVEAFPVEMRGPADFRAVGRLRGVMRRERVDVLHCHLGEAEFLGFAASLGLGLKGRAITRHFLRRRSLGGGGLKRLAMAPVYAGINGMSDALVCVSEAVRRRVEDEEPLAKGRTRVIYNPVENGFGSGPGAPEKTTGRPFTVGSMIRLSPEKGADLFVDVARLAREKGLAMRFRLAGDGDMAGALRERLVRDGLTEWVDMPGYVEDIASFHAGIDAFLLPSREESFGYAVVEAMQAGSPVVSARCGGPEEIVEHGTTGLLADVGDAEGMLDALQTLAGAAELRNAIRSAAFLRASAFSPENVMPHFEKLYLELASGKKS